MDRPGKAFYSGLRICSGTPGIYTEWRPSLYRVQGRILCLEKDQPEDTPPLPPSKGPTRTHRQGTDMGFFCFALHRSCSLKEKCHFDCIGLLFQVSVPVISITRGFRVGSKVGGRSNQYQIESINSHV